MSSLFRILFLILFINQLSARDVDLTIYASGYTGKSISVWLEDDLITGHRRILETKEVSKDETTFVFEVSEISLVRITLDYQYGLLLIEPGATYHVVFPQPKDRNNLSMAGTKRTNLVFNDLDSSDINYKISDFNISIDKLLYNSMLPIKDSSASQISEENYGFAIDRSSEKEIRNKIESIQIKMNMRYQSNDEYFSIYRQFVFANLEFSMGSKRREVYFKYLENASVAYNNIEFAKFFKLFYTDFFDFYSYYPYSEKLIKAFESDHPINSILNIIGGDTLTGTTEMQHLILLKGLYDLYPKTSKWKSRIIEILSELKIKNPYPEQRIIAANMIGFLLKGEKGTPAPDMTYLNAHDEKFNLSGFEGKPVYVQFFAGWNSSTIPEMELMAELKKRYGNQIEFLSISIDEDYDVFVEFIKKNSRFNWKFGWIGNDIGLWNEFEITHLPLFYFIDKKGEIISWPALSPSSGIESEFYKLKYKSKKKAKKSYWNSPSNKSVKEG